MSLSYIVSNKLKELRKRRGLTQAQVSYGIDVSRSTVASWELGTREPNAAELMELCEFFSVSPEYVCGLTEECTMIKIPKVYNIDLNKLNSLGKQTLFEFYNFLEQNETYKK